MNCRSPQILAREEKATTIITQSTTEDYIRAKVQSTVAQRAETTVTECSLTICV